MNIKWETDLGLNVALFSQVTYLAFAYLRIHFIMWRMDSILGRKYWKINSKEHQEGGGRETATFAS